MVHFDPALRHDVLQVTVGNAVPDIEKHRVEDDVFGKVLSFETDHRQIRLKKSDDYSLMLVNFATKPKLTLVVLQVWLSTGKV